MTSDTDGTAAPVVKPVTPTEFRDEVNLLCGICGTPFPKGGKCPNSPHPEAVEKWPTGNR